MFLSVVSAPADVIILKNGRRIVADSVTEAGDKVIYERFGGNVTIPKSLVDRIEKGGYAPRRSRPAPRRGTGNLDPGKQLSTEIRLPDLKIESIVRDDEVDEQYLQTLARAANTGGFARQNAVNAYLAAASFEARRQRFNQASQWAEQALRLSRRDFNALLLAAQIDIIRQQYGEAIDHLLLAERIEPKSPFVEPCGTAALYLAIDERMNHFMLQHAGEFSGDAAQSRHRHPNLAVVEGAHPAGSLGNIHELPRSIENYHNGFAGRIVQRKLQIAVLLFKRRQNLAAEGV